LSLNVDHSLIDLDNGIDLANKPETSKEADGSGQQEEQKDHDERVAKVQDHRCKAGQRFGHEIVHTTNQQVKRSEARREEGTPPPMIVLRTKVEIAQQHGCLGTGDNQNDEDQK
jgi:succinate dehydrogenase/fumarate reductase flavoprotein subunit